MESVKAKIAVFLGVLVIIAGVLGAGYLLLVKKTPYWVQINNSEVSKNSKNEYEYRLTAYDEHGRMKDVKFTAYKELREDAFLKLEIMWIRGVVSWEEVKYNDLPLDVKPRYELAQ